MKALILLGGLGTRLRPLTCWTPKPLLTLLNKPELEYQIDLLKKHNIKEVVFCTGYLSKIFSKYFGTGRKFGLKIHYVYEKKPLGTGGAIKNSKKLIDTTTVIFNGDILTDLNLSEMLKFHKEKKALVTISLIRVKDPTAYGLVETNKKMQIERFLEKPSWDEVTCNTINAGTYIFEPEALDYIPSGVNYSVERGLFPLLLEKKKPVYGYISNNYWLDIGTVEKYLQAHYDLLKGEIKYKITGREIRKGVFAGKNVHISPEVEIDGRVVLGSNTKIEPYVQLTGLVSIGRNCVLKKGVQVIDSVILDRTVVGEGTRVERAIIGKNCRLEPHIYLNPGTALSDNSIVKRYSVL